MQNLVDTHSTMTISNTLDSEILLPLLSKLNNNLTVIYDPNTLRLPGLGKQCRS